MTLVVHSTFEGGPVLKREFFCDQCRRWTPCDPTDDYPICTRCGVDFTCGECGGAIDFDGTCEREEIHL